MKDWNSILKSLADDPSDYERQGGMVSLRRHGREHTFEIRTLPSIGPTIKQPGIPDEPISVFVQKRLLKLDHLAGQMLRTFERLAEKRPIHQFIDGPVEILGAGNAKTRSERSAEVLMDLLATPEYGTTHIVQLMATAGQGKTVLLEHVAREAALRFVPSEHPSPLVIPIDLLGRYVGSVDDAIAGSLNNTFSAPGMRQSDVLLCLEQGWIVLALDGFDELVARIGVANAFSHITDLIDQLNGCGTVILSARKSFFELYEISSGIRKFLIPKNGAYATSVVNLESWTFAQGQEVFRAVGSQNPEADMQALLQMFHSDTTIVYHPFFLTRLAILQHKGETFEEVPGHDDRLAKAKWVIETFIERENSDKWKSKTGHPLLDKNQHVHLLGGIAEEMWGSGVFKLRPDELKLAAELGIADLTLTKETVDQVKDRVPTHAAFIESGGYVSFFHDRFLDFALGHRIALYLLAGNAQSLARLLHLRTLPPDAVAWANWHFKQRQGNLAVLIEMANKLAHSGFESMAQAENYGMLLSEMVTDRVDACRLKGQRFYGNALKEKLYRKVTFQECFFWQSDLSGTNFIECIFVDCDFGSLKLDGKTAFNGSKITNPIIISMEYDEKRSVFSPIDIASEFKRMNATITSQMATAANEEIRVDDKVIDFIERMIRLSERTCDVAVEDLTKGHQDVARLVLKISLQHGIVRTVNRDASGPRKDFYRFQVDRNQLLRGQSVLVNDRKIDAFWKEIKEKCSK